MVVVVVVAVVVAPGQTDYCGVGFVIVTAMVNDGLTDLSIIAPVRGFIRVPSRVLPGSLRGSESCSSLPLKTHNRTNRGSNR